MLILFGILIIIFSIVLGAIILIQNPKGGGLSSTFGGFGNQVLGVKQTTDILEKGTWIFGGIVALLCMISPIFVPDGNDSILNQMPTSAPRQTAPMTPNAPATQTVPMPGATNTPAPAVTTPAPADTNR